MPFLCHFCIFFSTFSPFFLHFSPLFHSFSPLFHSFPNPFPRALLADTPDIIVTTPARIVAHISASNITLKSSLELLVIDEADLVLTYGYEEDLRAVLGHAPKIYQAMLMSATLGTDVDELKQMMLRNAAIVRLEEGEDETTRKEHYI